MERNLFLVSLDNDNDEAGVRARLASPHGYQESYKPLVREWLKEREEAKASEVAMQQVTLEEKAIAVAREANDIARSASFAASAAAAAASEANIIALSNRRIAISALIIAAVTAIAQAIASISRGQ